MDVDRTLIRSVRTNTADNPYPYYKSKHCEGYSHFVLNCESRQRTISYTSDSTQDTTTTHHTHPLKKNITQKEHYHVYIRPGLKTLMKYLSYLQRQSGVKIAIASMAKRDYVDHVLKGLKLHCTENNTTTKLSNYPRFDVRLFIYIVFIYMFK